MPARPDPLGAFIVGRLLAERAGLGSFQATQWGAVLMATGLSPASILLVSELARLDAMRLSESVDNQTELRNAELRNMVQQALQKAQEAAETATRAAERSEQIISQLNEINQRIAKLEASTGDPVCSREFCEAVLAILHQLREHAGGGCVGPRRKRWFRCRLLQWLDRRR
ncbi:MAG: hypothetical protein IGS50_00620 [Synechococcales cyanobacterium C42_A2020_086]|nr:hypothetical protein [Synechococcales cyanobacterium C42_A2020_086]